MASSPQPQPPPPPPPPLGDQELRVLRHVAARDGGCTVGEAAAHFAEHGKLARTTVLTVMERLRHKGYLARRKSAGVYRYACRVPQPQILRRLVRDFMDNVLAGSVRPFVAYLAEEAKLSDGELRELRQVVQEMEARGEDAADDAPDR